MGGAHQTVNRHSRIIELHPLPLPLGEVDEHSEDGEGKPGCNTLSVTFGDSSPKGRAKGALARKNGAHPCRLAYRAGTPCLSLWERWPSAARTERGNRAAMPSQSPSVTALPKGEPRGYPHIYTKNGAYRYRYAPFTILRSPVKMPREICCYPNRNYSRVAKCLMVRTI